MSSKRTSRRRRRRRWLGLLVVVPLVWLGLEVLLWPDVAALTTTDPETTAFIERYRRQQRRQGTDPAVVRTWLPYGSISPHLKRAVVVAEDIDFFSHDGFAPAEIKAALRDAWRERRAPRGASTITQQLAKNLWLSPSRWPTRKLREAILTWQLERYLEKRRILELYLNLVELGPGVFGVEAAARRYLGKSAAAVDAGEAAMLAASLPFPRTHPPGSSSQTYRSRVRTIERRMALAGWLWKEI